MNTPRSRDRKETLSHIQELTAEIVEKETNLEAREKLALKCQEVVGKLVEWADAEGIDISRVKKLGGGFVNLVLLIETPEGKGYVAKSFVEEHEAGVTRWAQEAFDKLATADMSYIPRAVAWIDDRTLVSNKAEGQPIRNILERSEDGPEAAEIATHAFADLGRTLGTLHERTEFKYESSEDPTKDEARLDADKLFTHLGKHLESGLFEIDEDRLNRLQKKIDTIVDDGYVSLIHGDAHLDQFFKAPDASTVTIVDYDGVREGDPMADVARTLASMRDWARKMNVTEATLRKIEKGFLAGYREKREENGTHDESEFDQTKILAYELRLNLVQFRSHSEIREVLQGQLPEGETEAKFFSMLKEGNETGLENLTLTAEQRVQLSELSATWDNATDILDYLEAMEVDES